MTIRSDYLEDFCSSISMYLAGGDRMTINSSTDQAGQLVVALTFENSDAFHASMSAQLSEGALSRSFAKMGPPEVSESPTAEQVTPQ